ncbi:hypothetical protein ACQQ2T_10910 [Paraclostridium tenue]
MKKWGILLGLFVIIIFIYQFKELRDIKKDLETSLMDNKYIQDNISNINSNIINTINDELSKSHLIKDIKFSLDKFKDNKYLVDARFELSRVSEDSIVKFMYKSINDKEWTTIEAKDMGGLSYKCNLKIDVNNPYEYKVIKEDNVSESSDIKELSKYDYIPYHPSITYGEDYEKYGGSLILGVNLDEEYNYENEENNHNVTNKKDAINGFNIKSIDAIVGINGKEKIYNYKYKDAVYSENGEKLESENYEVYIPKKDYKNNLEYIKMKITYENKVIDIVDITNEIDEKYIN